jgi:L-seryl-tRNA(Ser) seleniumtransferase
MVLKVHPSNYRVEGFVEETSVRDLATLGVAVVADLGSGLVDATCPLFQGPPPAWLAVEPAAVQTLADGAALVTFSGDKLLGGPHAGIIAGRADLVERCMAHPLARALRPGGLVLASLQDLALAYLGRSVTTDVPFWAMVATPLGDLERRAHRIVGEIAEVLPSAAPVPMQALPGAGSAPGVTIPSYGVVVDGDLLAALRSHELPVIARTRDGRTMVDLRAVDESDDAAVIAALRAAS